MHWTMEASVYLPYIVLHQVLYVGQNVQDKFWQQCVLSTQSKRGHSSNNFYLLLHMWAILFLIKESLSFTAIKCYFSL